MFFFSFQLNTPSSSLYDVRRQQHDVLSPLRPPPIPILPPPSLPLPISQAPKPPIPPRISHEAHEIVLRKLLLRNSTLF